MKLVILGVFIIKGAGAFANGSNCTINNSAKDYYNYIYTAEDRIIQLQYSQAINYYDSAFCTSYPQIQDIRNVLLLVVKSDSTFDRKVILSILRRVTQFYRLDNHFPKYKNLFALYSEAITKYKFNNEETKSNLQFVESEVLLDSLKILINSDKEFRLWAMNYTNKIYKTEPYMTIIRMIDSHNYNRLNALINYEKFANCLYLLDLIGEINVHLFAFSNAKTPSSYDSQLFELAKLGKVNSRYFAQNISINKNHLDSIYNFEYNPFIINDTFFIRSDTWSKSEISLINYQRSKIYLQDYKEYYKKFVWQVSKKNKFNLNFIYYSEVNLNNSFTSDLIKKQRFNQKYEMLTK